MIGTIVPVPQNVRQFLEALFPDVYEGNEEHVGYYCLRLDAIKCPCGHLMNYLEPEDYHLILVWEQKDDMVLLKTAAGAQKLGKNPKIVEYEVAFGPSIDFYEACNEGMIPVERVNS